MATRTNPDWVLSEDFAISIDSYNWVLLVRSHSKTGEPTDWIVKSYFPTSIMLFESLLNKASRTNTGEADLIKHLEHALSVATEAYKGFLEEIHSNPHPDVERAEKRLAQRRSKPS